MSHYDEIFDYVAQLKIVDTHEHLPDHADKRPKPTDVLKEYLTHYFDKDLISAGMMPDLLAQVMDNSKPLMDRWLLAEPYWHLAENTGYGRALNVTAKGLYGIDKISRDTIEALDSAFQKTLTDPDWYRKVLRDKSGIAISILDGWVDYALEPWCSGLFAPVWRVDGLVMLDGFGGTIARYEKRNQAKVRNFTDYLDLIDEDIALSAKLGYVGYKLGLAYNRSLHFERSSFAAAEKAFSDLIGKMHAPIWNQQNLDIPKDLQDFCLHRVLRAIEKTGRPLQVHTGLQEGNGNLWANSDPMLLSNLFLQYPDLKFDLFHIGYPNWQSVAALAKNLPNVYIDMCWAHIISPETCVAAIMEYTDSVPSNKVSAFGGDYCMVDTVYGHQLMARQNVSRALANKVDRSVFDVETACQLARRMLVENPANLFQLTVD